MIASLPRVVVLGIVLACWPGTAAAQHAEGIKANCPVRPTKLGLPEFQVTHQGKTLYFCCEECVRAFSDNPSVFVAPAQAPTASPPPPPTDWLKLATDFLERWQISFTGALAVLLVLIVGLRARQVAQSKRNKPPSRALDLLSRGASPGVMVSLCLAVAIMQLFDRHSKLHEQYDQSLQVRAQHEAQTNDENLVPDLIAALPQNMASAARGLKKTYYRGNDEKGAELFNNGNYRTCTFFLSLRDENGDAVESGQIVHGKLSMRLEIKRAPNTRNDLFSEQVVHNHVFLRRASWTGPVVFDKQPVRLTTIQPTQRWQADLPLSDVTEKFTGEVEGNYYLGRHNENGPWGTYYLVLGKLVLEEGRIMPNSDLAMIELIRAETFGLEPVPEVPDDWRPAKKAEHQPGIQ